MAKKITVKRFMAKYKNKMSAKELVKKCAQELKVSEKTITNTASQLGISLRGIEVKSDHVPRTRKSLAEKVSLKNAVKATEVIKIYDIPAKIKEALDILKGEQCVEKDDDLRRDLGISVDEWKRASELEEFRNKKLVIRRGGRNIIYWGDKKMLDQLQKKVDILE